LEAPQAGLQALGPQHPFALRGGILLRAIRITEATLFLATICMILEQICSRLGLAGVEQKWVVLAPAMGASAGAIIFVSLSAFEGKTTNQTNRHFFLIISIFFLVIAVSGKVVEWIRLFAEPGGYFTAAFAILFVIALQFGASLFARRHFSRREVGRA
jgi:hypothetical protein